MFDSLTGWLSKIGPLECASGFLFSATSVGLLIVVGVVAALVRSITQRLGHTSWTNAETAEALFQELIAAGFAGDKWAKGVAAQIEKNHAALVGLTIATAVPTGYVVLYTLGIQADLSLLGFSLEKDALFQVALLAMCLFGIYAARIVVIVGNSERLLEVWLRHKYSGTELAVQRLAFDLSVFTPPQFFDPPESKSLRRTFLARSMEWLGTRAVLFNAGIVALVVFLFQLFAIVRSWLIYFGSAQCCPKSPTDPSCIARPEFYFLLLAFVTALTLSNVLIYVTYGLPRPYSTSAQPPATPPTPGS